MQVLHRSVKSGSRTPATLPNVFQSLAARQITLRRGELAMVAGAAGSGKSTLALAWAYKAGRPTLYFCADTSKESMRLRLLSMITDRDQSEIEPLMEANPDWAADVLIQARHIRWCFESAPSLADIEAQMEAFAELGSYPELVVIDNLIDCTHSDGDEWNSLRSFLREAKWWSRETSSSFLILHHSSDSGQGNPAPPRSSIMGKVSQTPALILTVTNSQTGFLGVCPVKNRYGPADPSGSAVSWLRYDPARMLVSDVEE